MQEAYRIKASNKILLENKFTLKKSQLLDSIKIWISQVQEELEESILKDKSEVINQKIKIVALQKQVDSNNDVILEQETIIQQLMLKLKELEKHQQLPQKQNIVDQDLLFEFEQELSSLKTLSHKLRQKANRLCSYFVCLQLYTAELGLKIQQDDFDYNLLLMPKIPDHSSLISSLQESEKNLKQKLEQQVYWDTKVQEIEAENAELKKENQNLKRCIKRFNITSNLDTQKQQILIQQLQDQLNDQQLLISDQFYKIKQYEQQNQCKQLNDFILKKRKVKNQQPVFNLELFQRKHTLDVCKSREEIIHTSIEPRIHSKTNYYKY